MPARVLVGALAGITLVAAQGDEVCQPVGRLIDEVNGIYAPCYVCDQGLSGTCKPCGFHAAGVSSICPPLVAYAADCNDATNRACVEGDPSYPACLASCAARCQAGCTGEEYVCHDFDCVRCGDVDCPEGSECYSNCGKGYGFPTKTECDWVGLDGVSCSKYTCFDFGCTRCGGPGCDKGSACYDFCSLNGSPTLAECEEKGGDGIGCGKWTCHDYQCRLCGSVEHECGLGTDCIASCGPGGGFASKPACEAAGADGSGCEKHVCVPEEQQCFACGSEFVEELGGPSGHYCNDRTLHQKNGYSCRLECNPPVARKDPHLYLPHGGHADFRGAHNETFAMLSAKDVAFNVRIEEADFQWAKRLVHGTKMAAAYWVVCTSAGMLLKVEYDAAAKDGATVYEAAYRSTAIRDGDPPLVIDNVEVWMAEKTLTLVVAGKWKLSATVSPFPFGHLAANKYKKLLDIGIEALYDADHDPVAPHGIFGQAYDGDDVAVSGKTDKLHEVESTTTAQAEGAIEGTWVDYKLASPFATDFKYSRFDATAARPRDVSKLTGEKTKATEASTFHAGASDDLQHVAA